MKIKNKKLFALLMLPAVIAMMVLPLCSFTTVYNDDDYTVWSSHTNIVLPYKYYYGSSGVYYGELPNSSRALISNNASTLAQKRNSIKYTACDYYITSSYRIVMDDEYSTLSYNSNIDTYYLQTAYACYGGDKIKFKPSIVLENVNLYDDISIRYGLFYDNNPYFIDMRDYDVTVDFTFTYQAITEFDDGSGLNFVSETIHHPEEYPLLVNEQFAFYPIELINEYLPSIRDVMIEDETILSEAVSYFSANLHFYNKSTGYETTDIDMIVVYSDIYNTESEYFNINPVFNILMRLDDMYNHGYTIGFQAGASNAEDVWGSIGNFLTSTVGNFFSIEFWDGFSLGGVMAIIVGALLFVAFLKVFAGG